MVISESLVVKLLRCGFRVIRISLLDLTASLPHDRMSLFSYPNNPSHPTVTSFSTTSLPSQATASRSSAAQIHDLLLVQR